MPVNISELLRNPNIVLSVLSDVGAYGFLLNVIDLGTRQVIHALKITLFFEEKSQTTKPAASIPGFSLWTQTEAHADPHGIIHESQDMPDSVEVTKKISPKSRIWEEPVFTKISEELSNGCQLHAVKSYNKDAAIALMELCSSHIDNRNHDITKLGHNSGYAVKYIRCIIQFLQKPKYEMSMLILLLDRLYERPDITMHTNAMDIFQIQTAANVLNLLLHGFVGTDLKHANIVYADKRRLSENHRIKLETIQSRALNLVPSESRAILKAIVIDTITPVIIDSGIMVLRKTNFGHYLVSMFSEYTAGKIEEKTASVKKKDKQRIKTQVEEDMKSVRNILSSNDLFPIEDLTPNVLGYLLEILLSDNVGNDWLVGFKFDDINTLTAIKYLIIASNEYSGSHPMTSFQLPNPEGGITQFGNIEDCKTLVTRMESTGGGNFTQFIQRTHIGDLYKLKKTKKRKFKLLKNKKNVKNKSYKVRRT